MKWIIFGIFVCNSIWNHFYYFISILIAYRLLLFEISSLELAANEKLIVNKLFESDCNKQIEVAIQFGILIPNTFKTAYYCIKTQFKMKRTKNSVKKLRVDPTCSIRSPFGLAFNLFDSLHFWPGFQNDLFWPVIQPAHFSFWCPHPLMFLNRLKDVFSLIIYQSNYLVNGNFFMLYY